MLRVVRREAAGAGPAPAATVIGIDDFAWSSGQVEGKINRLRLIKRQMFGRANLDLLKARLVAAA